LSGRQETDDEPSVFWISNPQNYFYGNVAAGSEKFGYWIEARGLASTLNLHAFDDNEVHSTDTGFSPYPMFWYPYDENVIHRFSVYRNRVGLFLHNTVLLTFDHLVLADNVVPVWVLTADNIVLRNTKIIGRSFPDIVEEAPCPMVGIWLHPTKRGDRHTNFRTRFRTNTYPSELIGTTLENVQFINWSYEATGCRDLTQIQFLSHGHYNNEVYNSPHIFRNVTFDVEEKDTSSTSTTTSMMDTTTNNRLINDCSSSDFTVVEVQSDPVGTISPTSQPGFLISSGLVDIADGQCQRFNECLQFCEGACMRSLQIFTNAVAEDYEMVVTSDDTTFDTTNSTTTISPATTLRVQRSAYSNHNTPTKTTAFGAYALALPAGSFRIHFEDDDGTMVFPDYAVPIFEKAPESCEDYISLDGDVTIVRPSDNDDTYDCRDLINNGSFESGVEGWQNLNGAISWESSSSSLRAVRPSQYIKSHCAVVGRTYTLFMDFSVVNFDISEVYPGSLFLRLYSFNIATGNFEERTVHIATAVKKDATSYTFSGKWIPTEEDIKADKMELVVLDYSFEELLINHVTALWEDAPPSLPPTGFSNQLIKPQSAAPASIAPVSTAPVSTAPVSTAPISEIMAPITMPPITMPPITMPPITNPTSMPSTVPSSLPNNNTLSSPMVLQNLALKKTTLQSTTVPPYVASNAVDGDVTTMIHTHEIMGNWWIVDLEAVCSIRQIKIYNRQDCCQERLQGAVVAVLDAMMETVTAGREITEVAPTVVEFNFDDDDNLIEGRYVRISLDTALLNLNEVEVYGFVV